MMRWLITRAVALLVIICAIIVAARLAYGGDDRLRHVQCFLPGMDCYGEHLCVEGARSVHGWATNPAFCPLPELCMFQFVDSITNRIVYVYRPACFAWGGRTPEYSWGPE